MTNTNIRARDFTTDKIGNGNFWFIVTDSSTRLSMTTGMNVRRILVIKTRAVVGEPTRLLSHNTNNGEKTYGTLRVFVARLAQISLHTYSWCNSIFRRLIRNATKS